jgi:hypothetical protein
MACASELPPADSRISAKRPCASDVLHHLACPEFLQSGTAFRSSNHRRHARTGRGCKLHRDCSDTASRTGNQHALAQQGRAVTQCAQRREASNR